MRYSAGKAGRRIAFHYYKNINALGFVQLTAIMPVQPKQNRPVRQMRFRQGVAVALAAFGEGTGHPDWQMRFRQGVAVALAACRRHGLS